MPPPQKNPNWKLKKKKDRRKVMPKWHDSTCQLAQRQIILSSKLLKKYPKSQFLKTQPLGASKEYKKLRKSKQKLFLEKMFEELDGFKNSNPRGYMNVIKSLKSGAFDKTISDDSSFVSPNTWQSHFQNLLGPPIPTECDRDLSQYVATHIDNFSSELDQKITKTELITCISNLENN